MTDDATFLVLNAVHLKRMASADEAAALTGTDPAEAARILAQAASSGTALEVEGRFMLMPDGTQAVLAGYAARYSAQRADPAVQAWYERFETLNAQFIQQVSEWQAGGEERAQGRLMRSVERLARAIGELVPAIPRYAAYVRRFDAGLALIDQGKTDYIARPTVDSVHNVWFEFHEDILSVLGRPREA